MAVRVPAVERVLRRCVRLESGCLVFLGARNAEGYGLINEGGRGKMRLVHRVVYEAQVGPIPEGHVLDHVYERCSHRNCVEVAHLEPVTTAENNRRMHKAGRGNRDVSAAVAARVAKDRAKTHCPKGHLYDAANTYWHRGKRQCRECVRQAGRDRRARLRAEAAG